MCKAKFWSTSANCLQKANIDVYLRANSLGKIQSLWQPTQPWPWPSALAQKDVGAESSRCLTRPGFPSSGHVSRMLRYRVWVATYYNPILVATKLLLLGGRYHGYPSRISNQYYLFPSFQECFLMWLQLPSAKVNFIGLLEELLPKMRKLWTGNGMLLLLHWVSKTTYCICHRGQ